MLKVFFTAVLMCLCSFSLMGGQPKPAPLSETKTYEVTGPFSTLGGQFKFSGYAGANEASIDAHEEATIAPGTAAGMFTATASTDSTKVNWTSFNTIEVPEWRKADFNKATAGQKKEWKRFMDALMVHENGHTDETVKHINAIKAGTDTARADQRIKAASATATKASAQEAEDEAYKLWLAAVNVIMTEMIAEENKLQADYDEKTQHGKTQGAELNTSIR
jgi:hypothetical protein